MLTSWVLWMGDEKIMQTRDYMVCVRLIYMCFHMIEQFDSELWSANEWMNTSTTMTDAVMIWKTSISTTGQQYKLAYNHGCRFQCVRWTLTGPFLEKGLSLSVGEHTSPPSLTLRNMELEVWKAGCHTHVTDFSKSIRMSFVEMTFLLKTLSMTTPPTTRQKWFNAIMLSPPLASGWWRCDNNEYPSSYRVLRKTKCDEFLMYGEPSTPSASAHDIVDTIKLPTI